jgi:hypothetical protein
MVDEKENEPFGGMRIGRETEILGKKPPQCHFSYLKFRVN